jgi:hypothetical protein
MEIRLLILLLSIRSYYIYYIKLLCILMNSLYHLFYLVHTVNINNNLFNVHNINSVHDWGCIGVKDLKRDIIVLQSISTTLSPSGTVTRVSSVVWYEYDTMTEWLFVSCGTVDFKKILSCKWPNNK